MLFHHIEGIDTDHAQVSHCLGILTVIFNDEVVYKAYVYAVNTKKKKIHNSEKSHF